MNDSETDSPSSYEPEDASGHIAIIDMVGRFPGARNVDEFWQNLRNGVESISFFTQAELADSGLDPALLHNPKYVGAEGIVSNIDLFDAPFFNLAPREAEFMDPQHRLFLESAWEALEKAGYDSESYPGRIGVFAAASMSTYLIRNILSHPGLYDSVGSFQISLSNGQDFLATRVSHQLNLKGPSLNTNTLCSSSFVAIHLACQSLLDQECDLALAGGVSLQVSRNESFFYQEGGIGDPAGHCRAFDAKSRGTVSGSGLGLIVLKRLEEALEQGDHILAVIRGSALNNDGSDKLSYTAPSREGQAKAIAEAQAVAGVDPETITLIEAHGTGTHLGDPIEVAALTKVFRAGTQKKNFCALGSVKSNIGHLVTAGGVASLIKTILALQNKQIPPSLNFEEPNPELDLPNSPFYVPTQVLDWKVNGMPRRAGVSSFGIGGTNVHLVVEEAPEIKPSGKSRPWQLLLLSAKTASALDKQTTNLIEYLRRFPHSNLADIAYTLQVGRRGFGHRRMLLCQTLEEALTALTVPASGQVLTQFQESKDRPVAFMFPGPGEQYINMGLELYRHEPTFRREIDQCAEILTPILKLDLRRVLYPAQQEVEWAQPQLARAIIGQVAYFSVAYAQACLWMEWGVCPQAMFGVAAGEYVAACLAGVFSLREALGLIVARDSGPESFAVQIRKTKLNPPRSAWVSNVTGAWVTQEQATDPNYWIGQAHQTQYLAQGMEQLLKEPEQVLLEIGPGRMLSTCALKQTTRADHQVILSALRQPQATQSDLAFALTVLGQLWLAGVQVDWAGFHKHEQRQRIPLPTYPFEHQRYWLDPYRPSPATNLPPLEVSAKKADIADWFYVPVWKSSPSPNLKEWTGPAERWLLFIDEYGLGSALADQLVREGQKVVTVKVGETFSRLSSEAYILDLSQRADYAALFQDLQLSNNLPQRIVHLWSITPAPSAQSSGASFQQAQARGFYSVSFVAQALSEYVLVDEVQLCLVSNHTQKVESGDILYPERATLTGPGQVISQENPRITCHQIDIALPHAAVPVLQALSRQLLAEIRMGQPEALIAYRGQQRWLPVYEPVCLMDDNQPIRTLREQGVYLITGGLWGASWALANYLAQTVQAKLVVVEPEDFPQRDAWAQWSGSDSQPDRYIHLQLQSIQALEKAGTSILVVNANLTDVAQLQNVLAQIDTHFGALHGVIHAVGRLGLDTFAAIQDIDVAKGIQPFESNLQGVLALEKALAGRSVDFCLLASSLASILGGVGQAAYAAANLFLDAFVTNSPAPWLSVNWDAWQFEGVHQYDIAATPQLAQFAMSLSEGGAAFRRILSAYAGKRIIVSTGDLMSRMKRRAIARSSGSKGESRKLKQHARPDLTTAYAPPTTELERTIVAIWQETLGIEKIGVDDSFFELGGDSLIAVNTITQLEKILKAKVPVANLYQTPNIRALATLLTQDATQVAAHEVTKLEARKTALGRRNMRLHQQHKG